MAVKTSLYTKPHPVRLKDLCTFRFLALIVLGLKVVDRRTGGRAVVYTENEIIAFYTYLHYDVYIETKNYIPRLLNLILLNIAIYFNDILEPI